MTTICAAQSETHISVAADSRDICGLGYSDRAVKIWERDGCILALAGSARWKEELRGAPRLDILEMKRLTGHAGQRTNRVETWLKHLAEYMRNLGERYKWDRSDSPGHPNYGVSLIIATPVGLYWVGHDLCWSRAERPFIADGTGALVALGAMHAVNKRLPARVESTTRDLVELGVSTARDLDENTGGEIRVMTVLRGPA